MVADFSSVWVASCWGQSPDLPSPCDLLLPCYDTKCFFKNKQTKENILKIPKPNQTFGVLRFSINSNFFTFYRHLKFLITTFWHREYYLLFFFLTFLAYRFGREKCNFKSPCERGQGSPGGVGSHRLPACFVPWELLGSCGQTHRGAGFAAAPEVCTQPFPLTSASVWGTAALCDSAQALLMKRFAEKMLLTRYKENCIKKTWSWSTFTVSSKSFIWKTYFSPRIVILKNYFNQELVDLLSIGSIIL